MLFGLTLEQLTALVAAIAALITAANHVLLWILHRNAGPPRRRPPGELEDARPRPGTQRKA